MSARFEIVRSGAPQPWHARLISNGRTLVSSESYSRQVGAERAVLAIVSALGFVRGIELRWNVEDVEKVFVFPNGELVSDMPLVKYVDERGEVTDV